MRAVIGRRLQTATAVRRARFGWLRPAATALVALVGGLVARPALGQSCNRPDLLDTMPPDGAESVPTNARLFAKYATNAEYLDEEILLEHVGVGEQPVAGTFDDKEGILTVVPEQELLPGHDYVIKWPRLRGLNSGNLGRGKEVSFHVGEGPDLEPPSFVGLTWIEWDVERSRDGCTDFLEDRYVFDFNLGTASDDGGRESLTLLLFQTKGPNVDPDAPEPVRISRIPSGKTVRLKRALDDGEGRVCFAAVARDLVGQISASGSREVCTTTVAPPFFEGCAVRGRGPSAPWLALGVLGMGLFTRRRARRPGRSR